MLRNVCFKNFVVFKDEQKMEFNSMKKTGDAGITTKGPYIFIGENKSGKSALFEGIRRCLEAKLNASFSKPVDPKAVSYFICKFQLKDTIEIISGTVCIPKSVDVEPDLKNTLSTDKQKEGLSGDDTYDKGCEVFTDDATNDEACIQTQDTESLEYYQFAIKYTNKCITKFGIDHLVMGPEDIQLKELEPSEKYKLVELYEIISLEHDVNDNIESILRQNIYRKKEEDKGEMLTPCQKILSDLSDAVVFIFPLRSIGPLQWSKSKKIAGTKKINYKEADARCEILHAFLDEKNADLFNKDEEERIFKRITNISREYMFTLQDNTIHVDNEPLKLLKTPEGILEAKYVSILLSGTFKTLLLEEPDRGMHPQFVQRMTQVIREETENTGKVVILTTHNTSFITPWTLSNCYIFKRDRDACIVKSLGTVVYTDVKKLRLMTGDHLSDIFFAKHVLFCEGDNGFLFLKQMAGLLLSDGPDNPYSQNAFLSEHKSQLQITLSDITITHMDGKQNTKICRRICQKIGLPVLFLLDKDAENQNVTESDCFFWPVDIEDMVRSMFHKDTDAPLWGKCHLDHSSLFLHDNVKIDHVTECVKTLLQRCTSECALGKFLQRILEAFSFKYAE